MNNLCKEIEDIKKQNLELKLLLIQCPPEVINDPISLDQLPA